MSRNTNGTTLFQEYALKGATSRLGFRTSSAHLSTAVIDERPTTSSGAPGIAACLSTDIEAVRRYATYHRARRVNRRYGKKGDRREGSRCNTGYPLHLPFFTRCEKQKKLQWATALSLWTESAAVCIVFGLPSWWLKKTRCVKRTVNGALSYCLLQGVSARSRDPHKRPSSADFQLRVAIILS